MTHPRKLLQENNIFAGKELGQNFLVDPNVCKHIVDKAGIDSNTKVLEIGPGLGALTIPISEKTSFLTAVEKDYRLLPILKQELSEKKLGQVVLLNQDILKTNIRDIAKNETLTIMGNVPYNISSQILFHLIQARDVICKAFLMFQHELAQRIIALPGTKDRSRLSAVAQYAASVSHVLTIGPNSFFPRPKVASTVLCFDFTNGNAYSPEIDTIVLRIIKAAFSKRRKTLKNAMVSQELGMDAQTVSVMIANAGIDPQRRAETLSIDEFIAISLEFEKIQVCK